MNLAFVPPADVPRAWLEINALFPHDVRFDNFVLYFERTWVGSTTRRPSYPIERWNQRDRILQELMTTNNKIEGFHHGFITSVRPDSSQRLYKSELLIKPVGHLMLGWSVGASYELRPDS